MSTVASDLRGASRKVREAPLRFVTAASLFDGHDAAINIMRRLIQAQGAEVIHLGHNRSVDDIVRAAVQEDADGIAVSSYQGGHSEFFRYMIDRLNDLDAGHIRVFGGGGGTITPEEIQDLMAYGVERIYHPHDGMELGLEAMIRDLVERTGHCQRSRLEPAFDGMIASRHRHIDLERTVRRQCGQCVVQHTRPACREVEEGAVLVEDHPLNVVARYVQWTASDPGSA